jgi:serine/threonine protein kinase
MVACIIVGLEYMHNNGVIHRDIKPENLVMESNGYVRVTDLGIARIWTPENSQDTSGTPGYMGKAQQTDFYSSRGDVPSKPLLCSRLFRTWCYRL